MKLVIPFLLALAGCYLRNYPVTEYVVYNGTYQIIGAVGGGTAWAVDSNHLITAGHMCEVRDQEFIAISLNRRFRAKSVYWEYSDTYGKADLCVLETDTKMPDPLVIADRMPAFEEKVEYAGYPLGHYYHGVGIYLGDRDGQDESANDDVFTAPCDHGASGSAVFTRRGVWGVLVRVRTDGGYLHTGSDGCVAIPLPELMQVLWDSGVNYVTTPETPVPPPEPPGLG